MSPPRNVFKIIQNYSTHIRHIFTLQLQEVVKAAKPAAKPADKPADKRARVAAPAPAAGSSARPARSASKGGRAH